MKPITKSIIIASSSLIFILAAGCSHSESSTAGTAPASSAPGIAWETFQDPLEQAFSLDVPKGWTIKGGMFRLGYSDHRAMVDITSPDGKVNVRLGDVSIPAYFLPNQFHHEGEVYDLGAQAQGIVAKYRNGQEFASAYGKGRFSGECQSLTEQQSDAPPPFKADATAAGVGVKEYSDGSVTYTCTTAQGAMTAFAYTQTSLYEGLWQVTAITSFLAPSDQVAVARNIVAQSAKSLKFAPAWIQKQSELDQEALVYQRQRQQARIRALSQQVAQFESKMQSMQNQVAAFERGQARQAAQVEDFTNALIGITPTTDPFGNRHDAWTGPKSSYWSNPATGQTVNSDTLPVPGWQPLKVGH
jgi:hypothetical protein